MHLILLIIHSSVADTPCDNNKIKGRPPNVLHLQEIHPIGIIRRPTIMLWCLSSARMFQKRASYLKSTSKNYIGVIRRMYPVNQMYWIIFLCQPRSRTIAPILAAGMLRSWVHLEIPYYLLVPFSLAFNLWQYRQIVAMTRTPLFLVLSNNAQYRQRCPLPPTISESVLRSNNSPTLQSSV